VESGEAVRLSLPLRSKVLGPEAVDRPEWELRASAVGSSGHRSPVVSRGRVAAECAKAKLDELAMLDSPI
jgi:hypothetical protein